MVFLFNSSQSISPLAESLGSESFFVVSNLLISRVKARGYFTGIDPVFFIRLQLPILCPFDIVLNLFLVIPIIFFKVRPQFPRFPSKSIVYTITQRQLIIFYHSIKIVKHFISSRSGLKSFFYFFMSLERRRNYSPILTKKIIKIKRILTFIVIVF